MTTTTNIINEKIDTTDIIDTKKSGTRSFKVKLEQNGPQYGRYNGDSPYQAATKALSEIIRNRIKINQSTDDDIKFYLVESTKGSKKKNHQYIGKRIELAEPVTYTVVNGDKTQLITKKYKNVLRKVKKFEVEQAGGTITTEKINTEKINTYSVLVAPTDISNTNISTNVISVAQAPVVMQAHA
jgi:hypothetical protein